DDARRRDPAGRQRRGRTARRGVPVRDDDDADRLCRLRHGRARRRADALRARDGRDPALRRMRHGDHPRRPHRRPLLARPAGHGQPPHRGRGARPGGTGRV
ncbi:MAG: hypothetical protein AVDCRST_MAG49-1893, partial [uncultured Thermomicrobiales bacterium]